MWLFWMPTRRLVNIKDVVETTESIKIGYIKVRWEHIILEENKTSNWTLIHLKGIILYHLCKVLHPLWYIHNKEQELSKH